MLNIKIATPDKTLFDGESQQIIVKTIDGVITVLPRHVPVVSPIADGYYIIDNNQVDIKKAMLVIGDDSTVTILISEL